MKKIIAITVILAGMFFMPMSIFQESNAKSTTTGSVTILPTCGLTFVSGAPISYGSLTPDATSANQTLTISNTGNVLGTLAINGTNWKDAGNISHILVNFTKFTGKTTTTSYDNKISLNALPTTVGTVLPGNNSTTWQLKAHLSNLPFSGSLTQTMDFSFTC